MSADDPSRGTAAPAENAVVVYAPTGRDSSLIVSLLHEQRIEAVAVEREAAMLAAVNDRCGPLLVAEEGLTAAGLAALGHALDAQPAWSQLPVLLLMRHTGDGGVSPGIEAFANRPETRWMQRPLHSQMLLAAVQLAIEARRRQLEVGELLDTQQRLNQQLRKRADQLQRLTTELCDAEDRERQRIAALLHDDLQQVLVGASLHATMAHRRAEGNQDLIAPIQRLADLVSEAQQKSRSLSHELFPNVLNEADPTAMVRWLADDAGHALGLDVSTDIPEDLGRAQPMVVRFLYRAVREAMCNVVKHANVTEAALEARRRDGELVVTITDRGPGFDPQTLASPSSSTEGIGLPAIRERIHALGGRMSIDSRPGAGTSLRFEVPVEPERSPAKAKQQPADA